MYALYKGNFHKELDVLHRCDVRECVNPDHLFLGTHQDNMRDMFNKGRGRDHKGESNNKAKLTKDDVLEIRHKYDSGECTQAELAKEYGVTQPNIGCIIRRETWNNVDF